jgi:DNA-binding MarR family transcriptional regulator
MQMQKVAAAARKNTVDVDTAPTFLIAVLSNFIARPFFEQIGRATGMNINEWRIMLVIAAKEGIIQSEISAATGLHKMTVSRCLRSLSPYVELRGLPEDRRKKAAYLTEVGWTVYGKLLPSLHKRHRLLVEAMDPEESKAFHATLTKLVIAARSWSDIDSLVPRDLVDHHK